MNFEQWAIDQLVQRGLFPTQANEIVAGMKETHQLMQGRWHDYIGDYPGSVLACLWFDVKVAARHYIEKNIPHAWFRPIFD